MLDKRYCGHWEPSPRWQGTAYALRRGFFEAHAEHCNGLVPCPSCGYPMLETRNGYEYCSLCLWEDDGQDDPYAHECWGGPNGRLTLDQARENFEITGCMYSEAAHEFLPMTAAVVFDPRTIAAKKRLCRAYDVLMTLRLHTDIQTQWEEIDTLWRALIDTKERVGKQVEKAMQHNPPMG
ncbi:MAG: CPCC family cysteine-rich protein [Halothiobacillaceae bacterium]